MYIHIILSLITKICQLELSRTFPMDMNIPPLKLKILLESNPLKSIILVRTLAVCQRGHVCGQS